MTAVQGLRLDEKGIVQKCSMCGQLNRALYSRLAASVRCGTCKQPLAHPAEPIEIESASQFHALIQNSSLPVLVDFWAEWCGPCKMVAPEIAKLASIESGSALIVKVNTEQLPDLASQFGISSIPTMILFRGGKISGQIAGARSMSDLRKFLHQQVGN
jgi:thioredoxin 2